MACSIYGKNQRYTCKGIFHSTSWRNQTDTHTHTRACAPTYMKLIYDCFPSASKRRAVQICIKQHLLYSLTFAVCLTSSCCKWDMPGGCTTKACKGLQMKPLIPASGNRASYRYAKIQRHQAGKHTKRWQRYVWHTIGSKAFLRSVEMQAHQAGKQTEQWQRCIWHPEWPLPCGHDCASWHWDGRE
eukprot:1158220-Pelagomonas_calceolata.AAC.14